MASGLVLFLSACNSDRPEPAGVVLPGAEIQLTIIRTATHPFLARYRLTLQIEGPPGCRRPLNYFPIRDTLGGGICINEVPVRSLYWVNMTRELLTSLIAPSI